MSNQPSFLKNIFSSCLGTLVGLCLMLILVMSIFSQLMDQEDPIIKENSVLKLNFAAALPELSNNTAQDPYNPESLVSESVGLTEFCKLIDIAKEDDNIKGIYLDIAAAPFGWATAKVVRDKLISFKESDKFIKSYSTAYNQKSYYLASVADSLYIHPEGGLSFMGFGVKMMYYKGLMDKLGVKAQIFYAGKFKSATEPFRRTDMSPENRIQVSQYLRGMYDMYLQDIEASRGINSQELYRIADNALIRNATDAVDYKLMDATKYYDEVLKEIQTELGLEEDEKINMVSLKKYAAANRSTDETSDEEKGKIAVVYAEGNIVDGRGDNGSIGGDRYASIIRKIRKDEKTKAIVLRVNSGGGSALASDIIWRELEMAKNQGIKVVTSMGDVAASGGYYIASNSDKIFAEKNTITGSIGVFGMIPSAKSLLVDKMGISIDTVKTGRFSTMSADFFSEFNEEEGEIIQEGVDQVYLTFKKRVSDGRAMDIEVVDSIAQGRVWLGSKAIQIGLVDELGGLNAAIDAVAALADLEKEDYTIQNYPKIKTFEDKLRSILGGGNDDNDVRSTVQALQENLTQQPLQEFKDLQRIYQNLQVIKNLKGIQMRLPYSIEIE